MMSEIEYVLNHALDNGADEDNGLTVRDISRAENELENLHDQIDYLKGKLEEETQKYEDIIEDLSKQIGRLEDEITSLS